MRSSLVRRSASAWAGGQQTGTRHAVGPRSHVNVASYGSSWAAQPEAWQRRAPRRHELTSRSLPGPRRAPAGCVFAVGHRHAPNGAMEAVAVSAAVNEAVGRSRACFAEQSKNWAVDETKARAVGASRRFTS